MPDIRELFENPEESFRSMWAGLQSHIHTMLISNVSEASDGKTLKAVPAIKQRLVDQTGNVTTYEDYAQLVDVPIHFPGGNGVTLTHGIAAGDECAVLFAGRPHDAWFQSGGQQQPITDRMHSLSDGIAIPGLRSMPRELKQVSTGSAQLRDDAKLHTLDHAPGVGTTIKSADASTAPASDSFDPFTSASKFISHVVQAAKGVVGSAVDGGTAHSHGVDHEVGAWMSAMASGGTNLVRAHPVLGSLISALDGRHSVTATLGGVMLQSATSISMDCPPGGLSLPSGSVSGVSLSAGAAASNVGALGGDLAGTLPNPQVASIAHLVGMDKLPQAASDAAAAALTPPVPVGSAYLNTSVKAGVGVLAIRLA